MTRGAVALLTLLCGILFAASLMLPWSNIAILVREQPDLGWAVLTQLRLPRALLALTYGAMLGASGAAIQALFTNPLASPDLTGTTSGAALGCCFWHWRAHAPKPRPCYWRAWRLARSPEP
jgi:iron complex transport system permease protein